MLATETRSLYSNLTINTAKIPPKHSPSQPNLRHPICSASYKWTEH